MIKAVIFDMYETLITLHACPLYFSAEMAADAGIPVEDFRAAWYPSETDRTLGKLTLEQALTPVLEQFGCYSGELLALMGEKRRAAKRASFDHLHPQVLPMLWGLKARGLRLGLVSNCYLEEAQAIRSWAEIGCFDALMLSCEQGVAKPDAAIFLRAAAALEVAPEECLFVGDGGSSELEAARGLGMQALQATWYMHGVEGHPSKPKEGFPQADAPVDVLGWV